MLLSCSPLLRFAFPTRLPIPPRPPGHLPLPSVKQTFPPQNDPPVAFLFRSRNSYPLFFWSFTTLSSCIRPRTSFFARRYFLQGYGKSPLVFNFPSAIPFLPPFPVDVFLSFICCVGHPWFCSWDPVCFPVRSELPAWNPRSPPLFSGGPLLTLSQPPLYLPPFLFDRTEESMDPLLGFYSFLLPGPE